MLELSKFIVRDHFAENRFSFLFILIGRLLAGWSHSPPPWLSRINPVSLGIYSAFSDFCNNQRQRETDLSVCAQRDWPRYLSSVSGRAVSSCLTDGSEITPPGMGFKLGLGWSVKALCIYWIAIKVIALVDGQVGSPVPWQLGWDHWSHQLNYLELMTCRFKALQPNPHYAHSFHFLLYFFNRKITGKAITGHMKCKFIQYFL